MTSARLDRGAAVRRRGGRRRGPVAALAWAATGAWAVLALLAMAVLAGPIGDLIAPQPLDFFDDPLVAELVRPEHAELVRVLIAIVAAFAAAATVAYAPARLLGGRLAGARSSARRDRRGRRARARRGRAG